MSYILDALRKSEEDRQKRRTRAAGSGFTFVKDTTPPKKKFTFGLILTGCMLLAAIILCGGWWWSHQDQIETADTEIQAQPVSPPDADTVGQKIEVDSAPTKQEITPPVGENSSSRATNSQPSEAIPYLSEMGADFQEELPELTFSGHVYSPEPSLRMIMINDTVVREGDPIGTDLSLEEITQNGVVIRYDLTRFQVKVF